MKLVFTSYSGIYLLDTETRHLRAIHQGNGMYYGLTWYNGIMYVAARNSIHDYRLGDEKILTFNKNLEPTGTLPHSFSNHGLHSILPTPDGELWLTAPLKNKIVRVDLKTNKSYDFYPNDLVKDRDHNHFNALTLDRGKILINVHNNGRSDSEIWVCDYQTRLVHDKIVMPGSTHSHCCWREGNVFWTCASDESQIRSSDGRNILPNKLRGYTRGIVLTSKRIILGESQRQVREKRATAGGSIHIYERGSMRHIMTYHWPQIGQIAEIRALDAVDEHHWPQPMWGTI